MPPLRYSSTGSTALLGEDENGRTSDTRFIYRTPMTTYSLPIDQTNLTQYMVEVTTEQGEEYAYYIFQVPDAGDHPGDIASNWCNQDEQEDESDDRADNYFVTEYNVFDNPNCKTHEDINQYLQRLEGDEVEIKDDRIYFESLDYGYLISKDESFDDVDDWKQTTKSDLQIHNS
nr:hypothetical protein 28 [bacterium]